MLDKCESKDWGEEQNIDLEGEGELKDLSSFPSPFPHLNHFSVPSHSFRTRPIWLPSFRL